MTIYTTALRAAKLLVAAVLLFVAALPVAGADRPPDSINIIQNALPDSISLDSSVVYVDFWASWCPPCRLSFPWMQELYSKYHKKGFEIVAISVDKDHRAAMKFLEKNGATFPILFDSTGTFAEQYGLQAMPTSFLYDRSGRLVSSHLGFRPDETDSLDYVIFQLVNEETSQ